MQDYQSLPIARATLKIALSADAVNAKAVIVRARSIFITALVARASIELACGASSVNGIRGREDSFTTVLVTAAKVIIAIVVRDEVLRSIKVGYKRR